MTGGGDLNLTAMVTWPSVVFSAVGGVFYLISRSSARGAQRLEGAAVVDSLASLEALKLGLPILAAFRGTVGCDTPLTSDDKTPHRGVLLDDRLLRVLLSQKGDGGEWVPDQKPLTSLLTEAVGWYVTSNGKDRVYPLGGRYANGLSLTTVHDSMHRVQQTSGETLAGGAYSFGERTGRGCFRPCLCARSGEAGDEKAQRTTAWDRAGGCYCVLSPSDSPPPPLPPRSHPGHEDPG
mmetsp:Transcript_47393/g.151802  ORF Transcript_47393/g.151802 Transcript_47393/m.151802 type:complete len:236 (+) Transcript_47393:58-765(+)